MTAATRPHTLIFRFLWWKHIYIKIFNALSGVIMWCLLWVFQILDVQQNLILCADVEYSSTQPLCGCREGHLSTLINNIIIAGLHVPFSASIPLHVLICYSSYYIWLSWNTSQLSCTIVDYQKNYMMMLRCHWHAIPRKTDIFTLMNVRQVWH